MTLKTDIIADLTTFLNSDEFAYSAIWTPASGVAQPAFNVIIDDTIAHGDENQELEVVAETVVVWGATTDVSSIKSRDMILIDSVTYEVINDAYEDEEKSGMSILDLRRPLRNRTNI